MGLDMIFQYRKDTNYTQPLHQQDIEDIGCTQPRNKIKKREIENKDPVTVMKHSQKYSNHQGR
jgi:hypothetical protein